MTKERAQLMKDILDYIRYVTDKNDITDMHIYVDHGYYSLTLGGELHDDQIVYSEFGEKIFQKGSKTAEPLERWVS